VGRGQTLYFGGALAPTEPTLRSPFLARAICRGRSTNLGTPDSSVACLQALGRSTSNLPDESRTDKLTFLYKYLPYQQTNADYHVTVLQGAAAGRSC